MTSQRIRSAAAALALAGVLGLAAPAHAARLERRVMPAWMDSAVEWIARLWVGNEATVAKPSLEKCGLGIDPNGCPKPPTPTSNQENW